MFYFILFATACCETTQQVGVGLVRKYFLFSPLFGEDEPILTSIFFQLGLVQPPTRNAMGLEDDSFNLFGAVRL